jgi:hypothetical protein
MPTKHHQTSHEAEALKQPMQPSRINKSELDAIGRALRANVKAAKASIIALGPKLKAEFEVQLSLTYPSSGDPVWRDALQKVYETYEIQQARVEARCEELGIPKRFRPHMCAPGWSDGWQCSTFDYKDYRAEMRRLAGIQIDDMLKSRLAQLELDSANVQFEIASQGCVTDAAKDFLARLPKIESLIPPLKVSEVEALIEGRLPGGASVMDALALPDHGEDSDE